MRLAFSASTLQGVFMKTKTVLSSQLHEYNP